VATVEPAPVVSGPVTQSEAGAKMDDEYERAIKESLQEADNREKFQEELKGGKGRTNRTEIISFLLLSVFYQTKRLC
jgi:hypothetical protein